MTMKKQPQCAVFYDGSCPLCSAEISVYRRHDTYDALRLVDVSQNQTELPEGLSRAAAMARFHIQTADGRVLSGAAAFVQLWRGLPRWRWLARVADIPGVLWLMELAYRGFLPIRPSIAKILRRN